MKKLADLKKRVSILGPSPLFFRVSDWGTQDMLCDFLTEVAEIKYYMQVEADDGVAYICRIYPEQEIPTPRMQDILADYAKYEQVELGNEPTGQP
jgi:hypothetical protein